MRLSGKVTMYLEAKVVLYSLHKTQESYKTQKFYPFHVLLVRKGNEERDFGD